MRRRELITLFGAAAAWPFVLQRAANAQQTPVRPLIGILSPISARAAARNVEAFRSAMRDLGYVEGRNLTLALRYGDGVPERMAPLTRDLIALNPDVLVTGATAGAVAVRDATQTIPIVLGTPEDPVALGLANSIARPGRNITGMWTLGDDGLVGKRLELLKLAVPGLARVGIIAKPDDPTGAVILARIPAAARALGLAFEVIKVENANGLDSLESRVARAGVQGLFIGQAPLLFSVRAKMTAMAAHLKLPAVYGWRGFADAGGLMSYSPNLPDIYRQYARLVDKILKGAKPGDLPFEFPTRYEFVLNLKTAKALGLTLPPTLLARADRVIE